MTNKQIILIHEKQEIFSVAAKKKNVTQILSSNINFVPRYREDFSDAKRAVGKSTGVARLKNNVLDHAATQSAP